MTWHTTPPPIAVEIELVTDTGKTLTGEVSFLATGPRADGGTWTLYMLRGGRQNFHVAKWRRVENA